MENLKNRFKSFTWNHIVLLVFLVLFEIVLLWFLIGMCITLSKNIALFGGNYGSSETIEVPGSFDYTILTLIVLLNIVLLFLIVYYLFFSKIIKIGPVTKEIVHGKVINIEENKHKKGSDKSTTENNEMKK